MDNTAKRRFRRGYQCPACGMDAYYDEPHLCAAAPKPIGCICPPGANRDCERLDCPRKAVKP